MKVFVTGGTGFVGAQVISRLIDGGCQVTALARSEAAAHKLQAIGASPVLGSLQNIQDWKASLEGCDVVVHCAAPVAFWGSWHKFENEISIATKNLLVAATQMGVGRFVHISSEAVLQDKSPLIGVDESYPFPSEPNSYYGAAKKLAETELLNTDTSADVIIIRPTFVWGNGSTALNEIAARAKAGSFMWVGQGQSAFEAVHIKNLAEAVFLATKKGKGKAVYFVTDDEPATVREFFTEYFKAIGVNIPRKSLPNLLVEKLATLVEAAWRILGIKQKPPLSRFEWAFVGMPRRYNITKIKKDLDYRPIISRRQGFSEVSNS